MLDAKAGFVSICCKHATSAGVSRAPPPSPTSTARMELQKSGG